MADKYTIMPQTDEESNDSNTSTETVKSKLALSNVDMAESVKVKLPDFVEEHADLWFWQVESAFEAASMTSDKKKYCTVIGQLPTRVMYKLADLRTNPPATGQMYTTLKTRIISEFADSTQTKITKLLGELALGDRKPSQLLAEMRSKAAETPVTDDLLKQLWMRNLPGYIRAILSADESITLTAAATMADRIMEASNGRNSFVNAAVSSTGENNDLTKQLQNLQLQVNTLTQQISKFQRRSSRSRSRGYSDARQRSPAANHVQFEMCWWHRRFGQKARKCEQPCNFPTSSGTSQ